MGAAPSSERRDYKVVLRTETPHATHSEIMERYVKEKDGSVGFIYWPSPLGFHCRLHEHHVPALEARPEVVSVMLDDGSDMLEPEPEPEESTWGWLCGGSRRPQAATHEPPFAEAQRLPGTPPPPAAEEPADSRHELETVTSTARAAMSDVAPAVALFDADEVALVWSAEEEEERERRGVAEVLKQLLPLKTDAITATRFLRAKYGDPAAAASMFRAHLDWRAAERVDALWKEAPLPPAQEAAVEAVFAPRLLDGLDYDGRPVLYFGVHDLPLAALAAQGISEHSLIRRYVRAMERVLNALDRSARPLDGHMSIYDVRHMSILACFRTMHLWTAIGHTMEANYPETVGSMVVVGAPAGSDWALDRAKDFMNDVTAAKIHMHSGTDARQVREALTEYLPPEVLSRAAGEIDLGGRGSPSSSRATPAAAASAAADLVAGGREGIDDLSETEIIASGRAMLPSLLSQ